MLQETFPNSYKVTCNNAILKQIKIINPLNPQKQLGVTTIQGLQYISLKYKIMKIDKTGTLK